MDIDIGDQPAGRLVFEVPPPSLACGALTPAHATHPMFMLLPFSFCLQLFEDKAPRTCHNFVELCTGTQQSKENPGRWWPSVAEVRAVLRDPAP